MLLGHVISGDDPDLSPPLGVEDCKHPPRRSPAKTEYPLFGLMLLDKGIQGLDQQGRLRFFGSDGVSGDVLSVLIVPIKLHNLHCKYRKKLCQRGFREFSACVRENFTITRKWDEEKSPTTWEVARVAGEQPNGTFVVPAVPSKPPTSASTATSDATHRQPATLVEEANNLVDSFAAVLDHALTRYQGRIKPEEAKALLITAYIQRSKLSFVA